MQSPSPSPSGLLPPGQRWGRGARTVVPYLVHTLQVKTTTAEVVFDDTQPIRNPVFAGMGLKLRTAQAA